MQRKLAILSLSALLGSAAFVQESASSKVSADDQDSETQSGVSMSMKPEASTDEEV